MEQQTTIEDPEREKQLKRFEQAIEHCKRYRRKLLGDWQTNVDYRRGKPFASQSDEDRVIVPLDWSLTKEKEAQLWSQVPAVRVSHPPQTTEQASATWIYSFEQKLNDTALVAGAEPAVNEAVVDCINAAGIGAVIVSREAITTEVEVPKEDLSIFPPELQDVILATGMLPDGTPLTMVPMPKVLDSRYCISRISPADFLWPLGFVGSDFDQSPWVGRSGRVSWAEALQRKWVKPEDKSKVIGDSRTPDEKIDKIVYDSERVTSELHEELVTFDEIFYRSNAYDPAATSFSSIHHLVFIEGMNKPVVDEPWKGQSTGPNGELIGATKYPIRVLTLTYITDDAIPPSDSAVGRPQVNEINKSRSQMIKQRERSMPVTWFDVNRVDPVIQHTIMRGTWQNGIPVQGNGNNVIGPVGRAPMPPDNYTFDKIAKDDYTRSTGLGAGMSPENVETKGEAAALGSTMQVRIAKERAKVGKFYTSIVEVLGGLLCVFEEPTSFAEGFDPSVSKGLAYSILADSTLLLDSQQRLQKLMQFINFTAKSGWVNIEPVLKEIASLSGLDPNLVITPPQPKPPVEPNISLRLTGTQDLLNPLALGFAINSGQAPSLKMIEDAKLLIQAAVMPPAPPPMPGGMPPLMGPDGMPLTPGMPGAPPIGSPEMQLPQPPPPVIGSAHPQWSGMSKVVKRTTGSGPDQGGEEQ